MAVAPSFENYKRLSDPFFENGKMYIMVEHPNTHNERKVRWYSDSELGKKYRTKTEEEKSGWDNLKQVRGFSEGPILIIRGIKSDADETWCEQSCARYAMGLGWHIVSNDKLPEDAPKHFKYVILKWDEFKDGDDRHMKTPAELTAIIDEKFQNNEFIMYN